MMDVLSGVLTGAAFGDAVNGPYQATKRSGCGHLFLALSIERFLDPGDFATRMEALVDQLHAVPRAPGVEAIIVPGEPEARNAEEHTCHGVRIASVTLAELERLSRSFAVDMPVASAA
jgi:LDH2 family malate/lactate/ureidoglycolate dehydrogenase